jgi:Nucleoside diphosphate kinase
MCYFWSAFVNSNSHKLLQSQFYIIFILLCFSCNLSQDDNLKMANPNAERTFIMCKPDAVQRGIVGEIIKRFEAKGFKLVAMKFMWVSKSAEKSLITSMSAYVLMQN